MKDLITITIVGILLWWVMLWPEDGWSDVVFQDNGVWIVTRVFSF
jgi:cytochrome c oxidase assembly factor CtaG